MYKSEITKYGILHSMIVYEETEPLVPKISFQILILVFATTDVFIFICTQLNIGTDMWMFYVTTVIFATTTVLFFLMRLHITIDDENLTVKFIRTTITPLKDIIDYRIGDIDVIRNYSGWGTKRVQFNNYICHGYEQGASFKIIGRIVLTVSSANPETMVATIHKNSGIVTSKEE